MTHSTDTARRDAMRSAALLLLLACATRVGAAEDLLIADFEGDTYAGWTVEGTAFGAGPAHGALPGQKPVSGFLGKGLVDSFAGGDAATGRLLSAPFTIQRDHIAFLIGGGDHPGETGIALLIDGHAVRSATGGSRAGDDGEELGWQSWEVGEFAGRTAAIEIVDRATGGWGHINIDHIVQTDRPRGSPRTSERQLVLDHRYLNLPVKNGAAKRTVDLVVDGVAVRRFAIELAPGEPDFWVFLDVSAFAGRQATLHAGRLPADARGLEAITCTDAIAHADDLYREPLRPLAHFTARRGWLNDPNGLAWYQGAWHLFFQHNPYGHEWGNMHWGHATSRDLMHWEEQPEALYPDQHGTMFSGSAVVDAARTSGFGAGGEPPLVLAYTADGGGERQCLAWTGDGRSFAKFAGNPVVPDMPRAARDPKLLWHEPSRRWVMALYVEEAPTPAQLAAKARNDTIHFLSSPDLKQWRDESSLPGFFECPDLFELPVEGGATAPRWVVTAANGTYQLGDFDGRRFVPTSPILPGQRGRNVYAAQTYGAMPAGDTRRIQIGWFTTPCPGMPFNQAMTVPLELRLLATPEGPRLAHWPVRELDRLHAASWRQDGALAVAAGQGATLGRLGGDALDVALRLATSAIAEVMVDGVTLRWDAARRELSLPALRHGVAVPPADGPLDLRIVADRTGFEIFALRGLVYIPIAVIPPAGQRGVAVSASGGDLVVDQAEVHVLSSMWERP
jgi:sucrose-6-phosphate hydrolase SacC (GH32 family)